MNSIHQLTAGFKSNVVNIHLSKFKRNLILLVLRMEVHGNYRNINVIISGLDLVKPKITRNCYIIWARMA